MALEAEMLYATTSRGMTWEYVVDMELWQIAAALGLHRIETRAQRDSREIVDQKKTYWEETGTQRMEKLTGYRERRRQSQQARRDERRGRREEEVTDV